MSRLAGVHWQLSDWQLSRLTVARQPLHPPGTKKGLCPYIASARATQEQVRACLLTREKGLHEKDQESDCGASGCTCKGGSTSGLRSLSVVQQASYFESVYLSPNPTRPTAVELPSSVMFEIQDLLEQHNSTEHRIQAALAGRGPSCVCPRDLKPLQH